ncbi:methionine--tRNA ligase [Bacillus sp. AGMB 02131]|uniref:Methionine--tRNA ligase n=1 Tax=Peribacillus faecalis TaxID=2772559 RepID=A0A927D0R6_9BACI|nr:methionine--tRNA ligase [Peribacillus faecalis]MBD3110127.1 methionine--tRNA ligase [Peribacillus faecalis]
MAVFIGGAWPYANGSLHVGHVSSLLPGDILARYYRLKGEEVLYVSGSDCNGTPIAIRAKQEGVPMQQIQEHYHQEFASCFEKLGFSYDCYTRTDEAHHHEVVQRFFLELYENKHIYKKEEEQLYCGRCEQFLPDRYVEGTCPECNQPARGDQCDHCSAIFEAGELLEMSCKLCGTEPSLQPTEHFYFKLSSFQQEIEELIDNVKGKWRGNAVDLSQRYVNETLKDRAITRDLPIGISVPLAGYDSKKIYVWMEAVAGYYTASRLWEKRTGNSYLPFWQNETKAYYVHGKDNIPFHSIIWPALMSAANLEQKPTYIISNEYVTLEKRKISTSRNWAVWLPDLLEQYESDSIRYFLTINAPEQRDTDFSWREFIYSHNSELLGAYGNFVNRTLKFIEKNMNGYVPVRLVSEAIEAEIRQLYSTVGASIEEGKMKHALEIIFEYVRKANKYFDERQPWIQIKNNLPACEQTIFTCLQMIANLAQLLEPFLPFSSERVRKKLGLKDAVWGFVQIAITEIRDVKPLFERIPNERIEEEREALGLTEAEILKR